MTTIYVVMWEEGEYSDRMVGVEKAFNNENDAKAYVVESDARANEYRVWYTKMEKYKDSMNFSKVLFTHWYDAATKKQIADRDAKLDKITDEALKRAGPRPEGGDRGYWYEAVELE